MFFRPSLENMTVSIETAKGAFSNTFAPANAVLFPFLHFSQSNPELYKV